jgi:hypothetical protein
MDGWLTIEYTHNKSKNWLKENGEKSKPTHGNIRDVRVEGLYSADTTRAMEGPDDMAARTLIHSDTRRGRQMNIVQTKEGRGEGKWGGR